MPVIGKVKTPAHLGRFGTVQNGALGAFLQIIFSVIIAFGGVYAVFNLITAGYDFISAGSDPQKVAGAWKKIWQTFIGIIFIFGAFVIAAAIGVLFFDDATALLRPVIPTP